MSASRVLNGARRSPPLRLKSSLSIDPMEIDPCSVELDNPEKAAYSGGVLYSRQPLSFELLIDERLASECKRKF